VILLSVLETAVKSNLCTGILLLISEVSGDSVVSFSRCLTFLGKATLHLLFNICFLFHKNRSPSVGSVEINQLLVVRSS
jgi:hypothetical protein